MLFRISVLYTSILDFVLERGRHVSGSGYDWMDFAHAAAISSAQDLSLRRVFE